MSATDSHRCSVLVVDDDLDVQEVLRACLGADGYLVRTARNGREALCILRSTPSTCVIVLDLLMAAMDGQAFRAAQVRDRSLAWIPVVALSAAVDAARVASEINARAFVPKPLDVDEVLNIVHQIGCPYRSRPDAPRADRRHPQHAATA